MSEVRQANFQKIVAKYPNQEEIAEILRVTPGYISQLVTGYRAMGEKTARKFERMLQLPANSFDMDSTYPSIENEHIKTREKSQKPYENNKIISNVEPGPDLAGRVPLINYIQAGHWEEIKENIEPMDWVETTLKVSSQAFALRVIGDSMTNPFGAPSIPEGFIVIVDPAIQHKSGSFVVARLESSNEAVLKQLIIDGPNHYLKSLNPNYRPIPINENCTICGVVKKVEFDL